MSKLLKEAEEIMYEAKLSEGKRTRRAIVEARPTIIFVIGCEMLWLMETLCGLFVCLLVCI